MWQLLAFTSAIFSASAAIFEKKALQKTSALNFSFLLSAFTLIFSIPLLFFVNFNKIEIDGILVLYGKSILGAVAFLLVMSGLRKLEISSSLPLLVLTPGVVAIFAFILLGESLTTIEVLGMVLLLAGTYILQLKVGASFLEPFKIAKQNKAYLYIVGAIILFTVTTLLDKTLLKTYKLQPEAFIPIQQFFFTINFGILFLFRKNRNETLKISLKSTWKIILLVAVFAFIYRYSHIWAIKLGSVALVLSIKRTSVFFATVIGGKYFKEQNVLKKSIATAIMIIGAILIILN